jgi:hypothetical protein
MIQKKGTMTKASRSGILFRLSNQVCSLKDSKETLHTISSLLFVRYHTGQSSTNRLIVVYQQTCTHQALEQQSALRKGSISRRFLCPNTNERVIHCTAEIVPKGGKSLDVGSEVVYGF